MNGRGNKMTEKEFPYEEIRNKSGDYFHSYQEAATAAIKEHKLTSNHVWSVCEYEHELDSYWVVYGPKHHIVNLLGFIISDQVSDNNTYFQELIENDYS